jgi:pimeloyl-ACP methyl ester carboxylesterase
MKKNKITWIFTLGWLIFCQSCMTMRTTDKQSQVEFDQHRLHPRYVYLQIGKLRLHYVKIGSDTLPTLFFIHGSPGSWAGYKRYLMDSDLLKHFRLIAIDRPGFGYSNFGHAYHLSEQAELIYAIVRSEKNDRPFHLIGHSLGGPVVVKLAEDHPDSYASLTLLAGSISPFDEPKEKWRLIFVHTPLQYLFPGAFRTCNTEIWYFKKELFGLDTCYQRLNMPITFIHGDKDPLVTVKNVAYGQQKLSFNSHVEVIIIPGANHFIPWEHFDIIKKHLLSLAK